MRTVSTVAGTGKAGLQDGPALQAQLDCINESAQSVRSRQLTRGNVLYGVLYTTLRALAKAQEAAAASKAAAAAKAPSPSRASALFKSLLGRASQPLH